MTGPRLAILDDVPADLQQGLANLRTALLVPDAFPSDVLAAADVAAANPTLPSANHSDLPFWTIDPPGSMDLDQAMYLTKDDAGYLVRYAIADVAAFVAAGGPIDLEAHRRGETFYAPNARTPLHPPTLSEGATSLLPGQVRPALVWELRLDTSGALVETHVARGLVRSIRRTDYETEHARLNAGTADSQIGLLAEIGRLREAQEIARGGVSLNVPEQQVDAHGDDWRLSYRATLPIEDWNAQISLLTGMAAAKLMLDGGIGLLRTLPPAQPQSIARLRRVSQGLGLSWPAAVTYPEFVRSLDPAVPKEAAMLNCCTLLFRGAGYAAFQGAPPAQPLHAAIAAPYAHVTAPLRRLVDRYAGEICVALCARTSVPEWVLAALSTLPAEMDAADHRAKKYDRGIVDLVEALVLKDRVGQSFPATVIELDPQRGGGIIQLGQPAIEARVADHHLVLGASVQVVLQHADVLTGAVQFDVV
ncbi:MAG: RNB domain-containing ribonuclease [Propionibacteriaceae bacterium]